MTHDTYIYDISPAISPALGVWPGDTTLSREVLLDITRGDNITLSTLRSTVHMGAHADGPNHYGKDAPSIDQRSLRYYIGECQVVHVDVAKKSRVSIGSLENAIAGPSFRPATAALWESTSRVLIATGTFPDPENWNNDFAALEPSLVDWLHARGVITIGIDTPSVDLIDSKDLPAHQAFLQNDMAILEGLVLKNVPPGPYELIALPLPLVGFDASPVRAILRSIP
ncbi:MAG TPA: cyclase family protein [Phycisphaerae bacterium]|nr:cyclase family protein [Phycisphaerae bacterium]